MIPDLSTWTRHGTVDVIRVDRFLTGVDPDPATLTEAERRVVIHTLAAAGGSPTGIADLLHENRRTVDPVLADPPDRDHLGRVLTESSPT